MYEKVVFEALPTEDGSNAGTNGYRVLVNGEVLIEQTFSTDIGAWELYPLWTRLEITVEFFERG